MEEIIIENENVLNLLNKAREITGTTYKNNLEDILIALEELEDAFEDMKEEKEEIEDEMRDNCAYYSKAEEIDFHERDLF